MRDKLCPKNVITQILQRFYYLIFTLGENFLTNIPPIMFNGTLTVNDLNLEYNYIERLEDSAFISLQPRRLYLGHNRISYVDDQAFNGVDMLVELIDLESNRLNNVSEV